MVQDKWKFEAVRDKRENAERRSAPVEVLVKASALMREKASE
jgi:hypothetical protein